jgi:hypothetical protein
MAYMDYSVETQLAITQPGHSGTRLAPEMRHELRNEKRIRKLHA